MERVLRAYGVDYVRIGEVQQGYRNRSYPIELADGRTLNLILYKNEPGVLRLIWSANRVSEYLAARGLPCRQSQGRVVRVRAADQIRYAALYNYLPGHTIPWEAYTKDHIKVLGLTMSNMHAELKGLEQGRLPEVAEVYMGIVRRMERYFGQPGVQTALSAKLGLSGISPAVFAPQRRLLALCQRLSGQQPLHMDFVRGNMLFEDRPDIASGLSVSVSGILDFEKTAFGHPLFDIARTLAFLLVDCKYKPPLKVRKYFLHSGYTKRGRTPLPQVSVMDRDRQVDLLEALVNLFLLHDLYKFLRHNPYESLAQNEHFARTKSLLLGRGLIQPETEKKKII